MLLLTKSAIANPTTEASISQTQPFPLIVINSKTALSVMSLGLESLFSFTIFLSTCICGMSCGFASRNIIHTKNSANYIFLEIINYILLEIMPATGLMIWRLKRTRPFQCLTLQLFGIGFIQDRFTAYPFLEALKNNEQHRYHEYAKYSSDEHASNCSCANGSVTDCTCTSG